MTAQHFVFDTNVIIRHRMSPVPGLVSAVVLQELTAGADDASEIRRLGSVGAAAAKDGTLLTPDGDDWYQAGKVLNSLHRGLRSRRSRQPVSIPRDEQQRLLRDVLIARSAKRVNAAVVTYNRGDFEKIRRFCDVRVGDPVKFL
ncbi:MAG TPA: type II toxin-antitoxin system VapC family toxin [Longimicrobium sp.]|nr:type II toxin-antitoxin system VapC family toxin [Longimicrobium sp.]